MPSLLMPGFSARWSAFFRLKRGPRGQVSVLAKREMGNREDRSLGCYQMLCVAYQISGGGWDAAGVSRCCTSADRNYCIDNLH